MADTTDFDAITLAADITGAWLSNPNTRVGGEDVPTVLRLIHAAIGAMGAAAGVPATTERFEPAVSVRKSLASRDHIVSMIDGKPYRTLRRHLSTQGLTPEQYRERYGLKADYPMVAPSYSEARRDMAKRIGLGNKGRGASQASISSRRCSISAIASSQA